MIATVTAFVILLTNPSGALKPTPQDAAPFFFPHHSETVEYASQDECMAAERDALKVIKTQLDTLESVDTEAALRLKAKADSMVCRQVTRTVETDTVHNLEPQPASAASAPALAAVMPQPEEAADDSPAKETESPYTVTYRIGRFDASHVFHGTDFNPTSYATLGECQQAFQTTVNDVVVRAGRGGSDIASATAAGVRFKQLYSCNELQLDPNQFTQARPQPQPPVPLPAIITRPFQVDRVMGLPIMVAPRPTRIFQVAELTRTPGMGLQWLKYSAIYASPAECLAGLNRMVNQEIEALQARATSMENSYQSSSWYALEVSALQQHRQRLQCVTAN